MNGCSQWCAQQLNYNNMNPCLESETWGLIIVIQAHSQTTNTEGAAASSVVVHFYIHLHTYIMLYLYIYCVYLIYAQAQNAPLSGPQNQHFNCMMHFTTLHISHSIHMHLENDQAYRSQQYASWMISHNVSFTKCSQFCQTHATAHRLWLCWRKFLESHVYWTVHHLDSWVKRNQLDATCFIITQTPE